MGVAMSSKPVSAGARNVAAPWPSSATAVDPQPAPERSVEITRGAPTPAPEPSTACASTRESPCSRLVYVRRNEPPPIPVSDGAKASPPHGSTYVRGGVDSCPGIHRDHWIDARASSASRLVQATRTIPALAASASPPCKLGCEQW